MLVLTRKEEETIIIDDVIEIKVVSTSGGKVKLGIKAPKNIDIYRGEVYEDIVASNKGSVSKGINLGQLKDLIKGKKPF